MERTVRRFCALGPPWFLVELALPGISVMEATDVAAWLFLVPCLTGGVLAALATRATGGRRLADRQ